MSAWRHSPVPIQEYEGLIYLPDLKLGNILMSFENENVLPNFIKRQQPMQCKVDGDSGRIIYRCHNDFGALNGREIKNMVPKIPISGSQQDWTSRLLETEWKESNWASILSSQTITVLQR